ncbi:hypothetical protein PspCFBP13528_06995 [Pseudomonas sp. CFBP13528]|jgi:hypothetical protein|uniref:Uncharacterized protein n=1 Tax=Pseudomonas fluorescens TaxID=294 RepID=A0A2N1E011_PSEFL|nr:hypothetical protein CIB54_20610 [Pseudomonas fluorescens]TKK33446.1 hypothetical protein PspCFBP13528_06995 [Pseudomonas sp. CFBP13528]
MSFENAAVHAARPVAGGRGKDIEINKMFKMKCALSRKCAMTHCWRKHLILKYAGKQFRVEQND